MSIFASQATFPDHYCSIDGTYFEIKEPHPFPPSLLLFKFRRPGVGYEIGLLTSKQIFLMNDPYPAVSHPDEKIYRENRVRLVQ